MARMNRKGRTAKANFIMVRYDIYDHPAWQKLSPKARCLYLELRRRYNGHNNGKISLSLREAAKVLNTKNKNTAGAALKLLESIGFIECVQKGHFQNRHASVFRLTCEATDHAPPTNDWRK